MPTRQCSMTNSHAAADSLHAWSAEGSQVLLWKPFSMIGCIRELTALRTEYMLII